MSVQPETILRAWITGGGLDPGSPFGVITEGDALVALEVLMQERDEARKWLRFIAETQHRLLDAFKIELTDEEWQPFAEALGLTGESRS